MSEKTVCEGCRQETDCKLHASAQTALAAIDALVRYLEPRMEAIAKLGDAESQLQLAEALGMTHLALAIAKGDKIGTVTCSKCNAVFTFEDEGTAESMPPGYLRTDSKAPDYEEKVVWVCMPCATAKGGG